jgi:hypothetical protein
MVVGVGSTDQRRRRVLAIMSADLLDSADEVAQRPGDRRSPLEPLLRHEDRDLTKQLPAELSLAAHQAGALVVIETGAK